MTSYQRFFIVCEVLVAMLLVTVVVFAACAPHGPEQGETKTLVCDTYDGQYSLQAGALAAAAEGMTEWNADLVIRRAEEILTKACAE